MKNKYLLGIETPLKVLICSKSGNTMSKSVDRDKNYMYEMWGTTKLATDYVQIPEKRHNFKLQNELHEKIRNDDSE